LRLNLKCITNKRDLRFFNTTGPCDPCYHYMLPPEDRLVGAQEPIAKNLLPALPHI